MKTNHHQALTVIAALTAAATLPLHAEAGWEPLNEGRIVYAATDNPGGNRQELSVEEFKRIFEAAGKQADMRKELPDKKEEENPDK